MNISELYSDTRTKLQSFYSYCIRGVWNDSRNKFGVKFIKTTNLAITSFLDKGVQQRASALTYSTVLALVPALAMLFAIARGFGFQNILQSEIFRKFPAQSTALSKAFTFVDSYLQHSSEGIFVGIGLIVLFWTLISLMMNVEDAFNKIWGIRKGRSIYRKVTDYTAIFLVLPVLMICESGITIFMATLSNNTIISPLVTKLLDIAPIVITWLIFAGAFTIIPYTKVKFRYAMIAGILSGTAFQILQWLFVSGQMYVSKYNAIYGSFAFLPLLLIWLQLTWVITLTGVMTTYAAQNVFSFNFQTQISNISTKYAETIAIILMAIIVKRFAKGDKPLSSFELAQEYSLPHNLVAKAIGRLYDIGYISIVTEQEDGAHKYQPAFNINNMTVASLREKLRDYGDSDFLKDTDHRFKKAIEIINSSIDKDASSVLLLSLPV